MDERRRAHLKKDMLMVKCDKCGEEKVLKHSREKILYKRKICPTCYLKTEQHKKEHVPNVNYRIKKSLASHIRKVMTKQNNTMSYIGCNIQYLREWFEFNFTPDMNWDNYESYWMIDHIIPVCKFDLTNDEDKLRCWNWSNLIPVVVKCHSSKRKINLNQVHEAMIQLSKFKEEGSTTKWFSGELTLNLDLVNLKLNSS